MDNPIYRFNDMIDYFNRKGITYSLSKDEINFVGYQVHTQL